jgi:hypothetical protein
MGLAKPCQKPAAATSNKEGVRNETITLLRQCTQHHMRIEQAKLPIAVEKETENTTPLLVDVICPSHSALL